MKRHQPETERWGPRRGGPGDEKHRNPQLASDTAVGPPLRPLTLREGGRRGCDSRILNSTPSSDQVGAPTCYTPSRALPVPGVLRAVRPPRGCGQIAYLHGVAGHVLRPPARGPSAEARLASARAGAAGGAAPRPSLARGAFRPAPLGPAWPGLRRAAPSGPSGCRTGHVSAEVRAWGGGGAGAGLPAAPGARSPEPGPVLCVALPAFLLACWNSGQAKATEALTLHLPTPASDPSESKSHDLSPHRTGASFHFPGGKLRENRTSNPRAPGLWKPPYLSGQGCP